MKNTTGVDTSKLASKSDLFSLKAEVGKIDVGRLKTVLVELSKLSNLVDNDVVEKTMHDKLIAKVNNIDTSRFDLKTKYNTDKTDLKIRL